MPEQSEQPAAHAHTYYAPEELRNGRESGAWAYGVACGISSAYIPADPDDARRTDWVLHVDVRDDHVDGAVTAIVCAGGTVRRVQPGEYVFPVAAGHTMLVVKLGE